MGAELTDEELIGYCELHCKTERALFRGDHVNRMIALAGDGGSPPLHATEWISLHETMADLCKRAKARTPPQAAQGDDSNVVCEECHPDGVFATDGTGPYDCYACGRKAPQPAPPRAEVSEDARRYLWMIAEWNNPRGHFNTLVVEAFRTGNKAAIDEAIDAALTAALAGGS